MVGGGKQGTLKGGGILAQLKQEIVHEEAWNRHTSLDARRDFNGKAAVHNTAYNTIYNAEKKKCVA